MVMKLNMVDLKGQYDKIREEVNAEIQKVLDTTAFINGPKVKEFAFHLPVAGMIYKREGNKIG